ncbi:GNAT family N-acetyltransferase [Streptomyces sp. NPDC052052]|uniref:GNAT family N-acetyltransferase n=1 Tax=Streptomyces sp. NPDC052052 TaxID=3154756 RepID=UPI00341EA9C2
MQPGPTVDDRRPRFVFAPAPRKPVVRRAPGAENHRMREVELFDGTVTLSPLRLDDVDAHLAGEDELLVRWLNGGPGTREGVEAYVRHCREQWDIAGPLRAFGIRAGADQALAGTVDLRFAEGGLAPGQVNVAYGLYPSWRGYGLATRAVRLASSYAAGEGGEEAVIQVDPENPASAAVARRAGFTPGGQTRGEDGRTFDRYLRDLRAAPR